MSTTHAPSQAAPTVSSPAAQQEAASSLNLQLEGARQNQLLAAQSDDDWQRLQTRLEPVDMPLGRVLCEPGQDMPYAYFPTSAVVSMLYLTEAGSSAEVAVVGHEGMVGIPLFMGGRSSTTQALVQGAGKGYRLPGQVLREEFAHCAGFKNSLLRFTQALIAQTAQLAVCNRHHSIDQQLCRWLLMRLDRQTGDDLLVTHEQIARLLGVRREGVTVAALALQHDDLIRYRRGQLTVANRAGLRARSCECQAVVKAEYDRLLLPRRPVPA